MDIHPSHYIYVRIIQPHQFRILNNQIFVRLLIQFTLSVCIIHNLNLYQSNCIEGHKKKYRINTRSKFIQLTEASKQITWFWSPRKEKRYFTLCHYNKMCSLIGLWQNEQLFFLFGCWLYTHSTIWENSSFLKWRMSAPSKGNEPQL